MRATKRNVLNSFQRMVLARRITHNHDHHFQTAKLSTAMMNFTIMATYNDFTVVFWRKHRRQMSTHVKLWNSHFIRQHFISSDLL